MRKVRPSLEYAGIDPSIENSALARARGFSVTTGFTPGTKPPKDQYDLAYGYVLRRDYALAEETFQLFLKKYPNDKLVPDAQYWLGESMFHLQRYEPAASAFLDLSTKHANHPKAPDALRPGGRAEACSLFVRRSRSAIGVVGIADPGHQLLALLLSGLLPPVLIAHLVRDQHAEQDHQEIADENRARAQQGLNSIAE